MRRFTSLVLLTASFTCAAAGAQTAPAPAASPAKPAASGGPIDPTDIMALTYAHDAQISPDGKRILYVTYPTISTQRPTHSMIWIVDVDGKTPARRFAVSAGLDDEPRWSPDGRSVAFLSNRPNPITSGVTGFEFHPGSEGQRPGQPDAPSTSDSPAPGEPSRQLWVMRVDGGEAIPLTALPNDVSGFDWAPDGRSIAFLATDVDSLAEKAEKAAKHDQNVVDEPKNLSRLWILDLATHTARRIAIPDRTISGLRYSPDGRQLALRVAPTTGLNDYFYHSDILLMDVATGTVTKTLFKGVESDAEWSPDSKHVTFISLREDTIGVRGWIVDVGTGAARKVGEDYAGTIDQIAWAPDGRSLVAKSLVGTKFRLSRVDAATGRFTPLTLFDGEIVDFTQAKDGTIALAGNTPTRPADIWAVGKAGGAARLLTEVNPEVGRWRLAKVQEVSWTSSKDGRTVYGTLVTPPGYVPGTPTKTVLEGHGGPEGYWWSGWLGSWADWGQMLATHGYVVLLPNPRGSDGQANDFARAVKGDWGGGDFQDDLDGLDMLVAKRYTDPARIGIGGWSYGGFMSAWAVTHSDRFRTAIIGAAPTDIPLMGLATDTPDFIQGYYGNVPQNLRAMDAASSIRFIDRVKVPVLVLHGEADKRVPLTLGLGFYRGLRLLGKPAEMVTYPREPHWTYEPGHQLDIQTRVLAWYDSHL